ncbi:MAG: HIT domain-containing protein [Candidatus Absconditicoccaceae bacterium]
MARYLDMVKKFDKKHFCPFCNENREDILENRKYFYVIPARSPYTPDHILIVPKRHVCLLKALEHKELIQMFELVAKWDKKLRKYHKNISLLLRDGLSKQKVGKSVNHMHFHLIPDHIVYVMDDRDSENRDFYNEKDYKELAEDIRKKYK